MISATPTTEEPVAEPEQPMVPQYIYDSLLRSYIEERGRRTDGQRLISIEMRLDDILLELRRANSVAREGAVSSVEIKPLASGVLQPVVKIYAGSEAPVDEALEAYGRVVREAKVRAEAGWAETVDSLAAEKDGAT